MTEQTQTQDVSSETESEPQTESGAETMESDSTAGAQGKGSPAVAQTQVGGGKHGMIPALIVLAVILILAIVFLVWNAVRKKVQRRQEMQDKIQKIRDENSDFDFNPLYDEEEKQTDGR